MLTLTSLGAAGTVTGSKHLLEFEGRRLLADCGLFQGVKNLRELNWEPLPVEASSLDAVFLTHAHLDHTGYLPRLVREGFRGPIYATAATRDVAEIILMDSARIQEQDAAYLNKVKASKHSPALPLYGVDDAERALQQFRTRPFGEPFAVEDGAKVTFRHAGHILGAATLDIEWGSRRIVFSGDLGRYGDPIMFDPEPVDAADYVVVESTYGDRVHEPVDPAEALGEVVRRTIGRGGTLLIPAFAVGRAQSLLYYLWQLREAGRIPEVPIFLDSPMAINASNLLHAHRADHRLAPAVCDRVCRVGTYTRDAEASKRISASRVPKIVVSSSGMATGGRVLHHLKAFGHDARNTVLLTGFQAAGTRGRALLQGSRELKIHGQWIHVGAEVESLSMLSAHADADELIRWLHGFGDGSDPGPRRVFVVHGEPQSSEALRSRISKTFGWDAVAPRQNQVHQL